MSDLVWTNITVRLGDLKPWADNPRQSSKAQAKRILASFERFGQVAPVAVGPSLEVYDGHQRLSALLTVYGPDYQIDARQSSRALTDDERRALVLALANATGSWSWDALSGWNVDTLKEWGMTADTLKGWKSDVTALGEFLKSEQPAKDAEPQTDRAAELLEKWQVKAGDLWQIGEHRLICGDCTDKATVEKVMQGEKAGAMFTDPPYNIEMKATSKDRKIDEIENDSMSDAEFSEFISSFLGIAKEYVTDEVYVCCDWRNDHIFKACMKEAGWPVKCEIVWNKETRAQNLNKWAFAHEFILYHGYFGAPTIDTNVWKMKREYSDVHLTPKPIELIEKALSAGNTEVVYDPFSGTGSTAVACQNLSRRCRAVEISPAYCAVALERMSTAFPGLDIRKVE